MKDIVAFFCKLVVNMLIYMFVFFFVGLLSYIFIQTIQRITH